MPGLNILAYITSYVRQDTAEHVQEYTFEAILISMGTDASIWVVRNLRSEMRNRNKPKPLAQLGPILV